MATEAEAEKEYLQQSAAPQSQMWSVTYCPPVWAALNKIPMLTWMTTRASAAAYAGFIRTALTEFKKATMTRRVGRMMSENFTRQTEQISEERIGQHRPVALKARKRQTRVLQQRAHEQEKDRKGM